ncbi:MAG: 16S rRNA (uracil(1498)-N(3))-methyltransferase [Syntrophales bacterium]|nr:16S rRNA (uracil(1498)-N(3))-methyltransferase [Syntrophales bacterium]
MSIHRIYRPGLTAGAGRTELEDEDFHYVKNVLRLKPGSLLMLFDGVGNEYTAVIEGFESSKAILSIKHSKRILYDSPSLTLAQALPKESKMDFIVQKATELGVRYIIPFTSSRTVPKLTADKAAARVTRWRKIASEAAKQCGGAIVPKVSEIVNFEAMLEEAARSPLALFFWEEEKSRGIRDIFSNPSGPEISGVSVVVGPEGGFSRSETAAARDRDFTTVHLGRRILRVETAALVILSIIQYEIGSIGLPLERKATQ